ncbi:hypothetical protein INR49_001805, partial [Caranx melampygus]
GEETGIGDFRVLSDADLLLSFKQQKRLEGWRRVHFGYARVEWDQQDALLQNKTTTSGFVFFVGYPTRGVQTSEDDLQLDQQLSLGDDSLGFVAHFRKYLLTNHSATPSILTLFIGQREVVCF